MARRKCSSVKQNQIEEKNADEKDFEFDCPFTMTIVGSTGCG